MAKEIRQLNKGSNPLVSVIIPIFNSEKFLRSCIDSIMDQTYSKFEIILVDDGSNDASAKICDEYASRYKQIKVKHIQNGGVSRARNIGLKMSLGDYVMFADSDDSFEPDAIECYVNAALKYKADIVRSGYIRIYTKSDYSESVSCLRDMEFDNPLEYYKWLERSEYYSFVWNSFTRREILEDSLFREDLNWLEDHIFFYALYPRCKKMIALSKPLYRYYIRNEGSNLSDIRNADMIWKAAEAELTGKIALCAQHDKEIETDAWLRYACMIEKFVFTLYNNNNMYVRRQRKLFSCRQLIGHPSLMRDSRIFFNIQYPFFIRDMMLRIIYFIRRHR